MKILAGRDSTEIAGIDQRRLVGLRRARSLTSGAGWNVYWREPVVAVGLSAFDEGEEFVLDFFGDGAAGATADFYAVDGADRRDFDGGAAEEHFVDDVEHFAGNDLFSDGNAEVLADGDDAGAGDAGQGGIRNGRSDDGAAVHHKNILAGTFADLAVGIEG